MAPVPGTEQLATKADLAELKVDLKAEIRESKAELMPWTLTFFVPLWLGVWGMLAALVPKA